MRSDWRRLEAFFDASWEALAHLGKCDSYGGMEYRRVRSEWEAAGRPVNVSDFIIRRANVGAEDGIDLAHPPE